MPKIVAYKTILPIENLHLLCSYLSRQHAVMLAQRRGIEVGSCPEYISTEQHKKITQYAMAAGFEFDGFDGQHIENYSVVRIYKQAPFLFKLINHIDRSFKLIIKPHTSDGETFVTMGACYDYGGKIPAVVRKASYFVSTPDVWTVNPQTQMLNSRVGYNLGLCNFKDHTVSYNIEYQLDVNILIHEVTHSKHPELNEKIIRESTAMVVKESPAFLGSVMHLKSKLDKEITRIARDFERFDRKVGQILGTNENRPAIALTC